MKKQFRKFIATIVTIAMMFTMASPVMAADDNVYLTDLRIVYAESLEEAQAKVDEYNANMKAELEAEDLGNLYDEQKLSLYEYNLNEGTEAYMGFIGLGEEPHVYIAYASGTNIDNAITDISVMDMNGGYTEGNLQAALEESYTEYEAFAQNYIAAIEYFKTAYASGDALTDSAFRQLNIYFDPDSEMKLGDLLFNDITPEALATILLQGNINILENMRALLSMGTSYNESGLSYLETVVQTAAQYDENNAVFDGENWYELAIKVSGTFPVFVDMMNEYNEVRNTLDYTDENITEEELTYLEYASMIERLENTTYINGESLADFIYNYEATSDAYLTVYPLIAAMNEGQMAMTELFQYYDVVRYSVSDISPEDLEEQLAMLEETYADGLSIYLGVDRSLYDGTFAVTTDAERAAATYGRSIGADVFGRTNSIVTYVVSGAATIGNIALLVKNLGGGASSALKGFAAQQQAFLQGQEVILNGNPVPFKDALTTMAQKLNVKLNAKSSLYDQASQLLSQPYLNTGNPMDHMAITEIRGIKVMSESQTSCAAASTKTAQTTGMSTAGAWAIFGGITLAILAANIGVWIYNYYNPELTDIPIAMVDSLSTQEGDRYIFYDAATMLEPDEDGIYHAACLNAFEGEAWNAIYYTKSYEAGNALLADFNINYDNHKADKGYLPIHKFGDTVCFNLNKHAFGDELQIYLSVAQSDQQKSGAADVPDVVGSIVSFGGYLIAAGIGVAVGMCLMAGIRRSKDIKKKGENE